MFFNLKMYKIYSLQKFMKFIACHCTNNMEMKRLSLGYFILILQKLYNILKSKISVCTI